VAKAETIEAKKVQATANEIRRARFELPHEDYQRVKRVSKANGLSVTAYITHTILRQLRIDEKDDGAK
jgi:hypothetical protein